MRFGEGLLTTWSAALRTAGIADAELISTSTESEYEAGGGEAIFRWGTMILRIVRDRGQDFVDVASVVDAAQHFRLDDLGIAQGWRDVELVLARQAPIPLVEELREVVRHRKEIEDALSARQLATTVVSVADACGRREQAFLEKLRRLAKGGREDPVRE